MACTTTVVEKKAAVPQTCIPYLMYEGECFKTADGRRYMRTDGGAIRLDKTYSSVPSVASANDLRNSMQYAGAVRITADVTLNVTFN